MLKKIIIILYSIFLIFILTSCLKKENSITLEPINIDFDLTNVSLDKLSFHFPTDDWELTESKYN